jgi:hypothetical protein
MPESSAGARPFILDAWYVCAWPHEVRTDQILSRMVPTRTSTPEEFGSMIKSEYSKWAKVIRDAGIKAQ